MRSTVRLRSTGLAIGVLLTIAGGVLLMAAVPLLLAAAAMQLSASAGLSLAASLAIVAVVALVLMIPTLVAAYRIARVSVKALISPVRDLEINLRSLAGDAPPRPSAFHPSDSSYSSNPYSNGAE